MSEVCPAFIDRDFWSSPTGMIWFVPNVAQFSALCGALAHTSQPATRIYLVQTQSTNSYYRRRHRELGRVRRKKTSGCSSRSLLPGTYNSASSVSSGFRTDGECDLISPLQTTREPSISPGRRATAVATSDSRSRQRSSWSPGRIFCDGCCIFGCGFIGGGANAGSSVDGRGAPTPLCSRPGPGGHPRSLPGACDRGAHGQVC